MAADKFRTQPSKKGEKNPLLPRQKSKLVEGD